MNCDVAEDPLNIQAVYTYYSFNLYFNSEIHLGRDIYNITEQKTHSKLEKHSESTDLSQAVHSWVHARQESFKKVLEPDGNPEHHQFNHHLFLVPLSTFPESFIKIHLELLELSCANYDPLAHQVALYVLTATFN